VTALPSKPGITGASTLAIPKNWDPHWFRDFIINQLKGADVRNAVGANGIVVSGNISTPYATISIGSGGLSLSVNVNGTFEPLFASNSSAGAAATNQIQLSNNAGDSIFLGIAGSGNTGVQWSGGPTGEQMFVGGNGGPLTFATNNTYRGQINSSGWVIATPTVVPTGNNGALTVNGISGNYTASLFGGSTTGSSFGLNIQAGTNASDICAIFRNQGNTQNFFEITGAGVVTVTGGATLLATFSTLTNGAGASAGTLTNAPSAGNPTKWIAINDNGTTRRIPAW
jgi:hypothetical protein